MYLEKTFPPADLRPPGHASRKVWKAFGNVSRKNIPARRPSAAGLRLAKSPESLRKRAPKKCVRPSAFGLRATPREKLLQPSETCPEKMCTPVGPRPPGHASRKVWKAFGKVPRKNVHACQLSAAGLRSAKSLQGGRQRGLKVRSRLRDSGRNKDKERETLRLYGGRREAGFASHGLKIFPKKRADGMKALRYASKQIVNLPGRKDCP